MLVAQGDTSTAYATALAARDLDLPLAHVEAGLRTDHPLRPFPEEYFRRCISRLAALHLAPTLAAATNLRGEGVAAESIHLVGNTVVDLLREQVENGFGTALAFLPDTPRIITLTLHRRENYGRGLDVVCTAILDLLARENDIGVVCPVHPNPAVGARIRRHLAAHPRIRLTDPLAYRPFIALLARSTLVVTDSGGIQEEAPYLGVPVLVVRENTERPESVAVGTTTLVPVQHDRIVDEIERRLASARPPPLPFAVASPYGDGRSGERCADRIATLFPHTRRSRARSGAGRLNTSMLADERLESTAGDARVAAARLRHWLLHGPAQLSDGRHCGGVAGRISAGTPVYVYAEITGYFLHWLADLTHVESREVVSERARRALDWATRQFAAGRVPPTRAYLVAAEPDWRNDAMFFFDLAMLLAD